MTVVVDTNIIFSALLRFPNRFASQLLMEDVDFCLPHFAVVELFKHKEKIVKHSKMSEEEVLEILYRLFKNIRLVNEESIDVESWKKAYNLCYEIDEKDTPFVALTIDLNAVLWTSDIKLISALENRGFSSFYSL